MTFELLWNLNLTWSIWWLIFLPRPNISMLGTPYFKFIWNSFLQSLGRCCTQSMACELTFNSSVFAYPFDRFPQHFVVYWTISIPNCKMYKNVRLFLHPKAYNLLFHLKLTIIRTLEWTSRSWIKRVLPLNSMITWKHGPTYWAGNRTRR